MKRVAHTIRLHTIDLDRVRPYFRDVEALAKEASRSHDPGVILTALAVLSRQSATITELGAKS
jgi:hypothetical protein